MSASFEDAAARKKQLEQKLRILRHKEQAKAYEDRCEWADALRLYTEILTEDPADEEAQDGARRMRESLIIRLYDEGSRLFEAEQWPQAVETFTQLLHQVEQSGQYDYQDARARLQQAQEKIAPPRPKFPMPFWAIGGGATIVLLVLIFIVALIILRPSSPSGGELAGAAIKTLTSTPDVHTPESATPNTYKPQNNPDTPTLPVATDTPAAELTIEPSQTLIPEPTDEPTIEPTSPPAVAPTSKSATGPTATPIAVSSPEPATTPTEAPTPTGKIAVPVYDTQNGTYHVYIARANDGWRPKLFLADSSQPAFSADGQWIIVRTWPSEIHHFGQRLVLFPSLNIEAGDERWMTLNLEDAHPSLRRGDNEIVFHTLRGGREQPDLFTLGAWEGAETSVDNQVLIGRGENPDWLGSKIVYYSPESPEGVYVRDSSGSSKQILNVFGVVVPAGAPDGDQVAVSLKKPDDYWHVYTLSAGQGEKSLKQLTHQTTNDQLPVWSPDGQFIAFVSNRNNHYAVWVMNADGSNQDELFRLNGPLDGTVSLAVDLSRGWSEERLSWAP
ncbi:MAG: PD40 domain-containing protein [Anaerolineae bacterium]|nr:PD40 domain-containing protein [Anaerolineae bacterium]